MEQEFEVTGKLLRLRPEMAADGIKLGDKVKGKLLHARYSRYMQQVAEVDPALVAELAEVGAFHPPQQHCTDRHHFAIAGQQRQQRHRAELCPSLQSQRHQAGQEEQGERGCLLL